MAGARRCTLYMGRAGLFILVTANIGPQPQPPPPKIILSFDASLSVFLGDSRPKAPSIFVDLLFLGGMRRGGGPNLPVILLYNYLKHLGVLKAVPLVNYAFVPGQEEGSQSMTYLQIS